MVLGIIRKLQDNDPEMTKLYLHKRGSEEIVDFLAISEAIRDNKTLTHLEILGGTDQYEWILSCLGNIIYHQSLTHLTLNLFNFEDVGIILAMTDIIRNNTTLEEITFTYKLKHYYDKTTCMYRRLNYSKDIDNFMMIMNAVKNNRNIKRLKFDIISLTIDNIIGKAINDIIIHNQTLEELTIHNCSSVYETSRYENFHNAILQNHTLLKCDIPSYTSYIRHRERFEGIMNKAAIAARKEKWLTHERELSN